MHRSAFSSRPRNRPSFRKFVRRRGSSVWVCVCVCEIQRPILVQRRVDRGDKFAGAEERYTLQLVVRARILPIAISRRHLNGNIWPRFRCLAVFRGPQIFRWCGACVGRQVFGRWWPTCLPAGRKRRWRDSTPGYTSSPSYPLSRVLSERGKLRAFGILFFYDSAAEPCTIGVTGR